MTPLMFMIKTDDKNIAESLRLAFPVKLENDKIIEQMLDMITKPLNVEVRTK